MVELTLTNVVTVRTDQVPESVLRRLVKRAIHRDPEYAKRKKQHLSLEGLTPTIATCASGAGTVTFWRGMLGDIIRELRKHRLQYVVMDRRLWLPRIPMPCRVVLRDYQVPPYETCRARQQTLIRAPAGSGKTETLLAAIAHFRQPTLVLVWQRTQQDTWLQRIPQYFDFAPGGIGGAFKTPVLAPITIGLVQSVRNRLPELLRQFGAVVCDECVAAGTAISMGDGSTKPIEDVRVGDLVSTPLGPRRVTRTWFRGARQVVAVGRLRCTPEHPVLTDRGFIPATKVCSCDVVWYHPTHDEMFGVQQAVASQQSWRDSRQMPDEFHSKRCVSCVRRRGCEAQPWCPRCLVRPRRGAVEQRAFRSYLREYETRGFGACRSDSADGLSEANKAALPLGAGAYVEPSQPVEDCSVSGRAEGARTPDDRARGNPRVRPERLGTDTERDDCCREAAADWIREGDQDRKVPRRLPSPSFQASRRDRRRKPPSRRKSSDGRREGSVLTETRLHGTSCGCSESKAGVSALRHQPDHSRSAADTAALWLPVWDLEVDEAHCFYADGVLVHNCQRFAATTLREVVNEMPAAVRLGASDDERRADGREFLLYDTFGPTGWSLAGEVGTCPVEIQAVATRTRHPSIGFRIDWSDVIDTLTTSEDRNALIVNLACRDAREGHRVLVWSDRVDHCLELARAVAARGVSVGLYMGTPEWKEEADRTKAGLRDGSVSVGIGTQIAEQSLDIPPLDRGIMTCATADRKMYRFRQMRGRLARPYPGKHSILYYLWDRRTFILKQKIGNIESEYPVKYCRRDRRQKERERMTERAVVTLETLKAGATALGVEFNKNTDARKLEKLIERELRKDKTYGVYACEACGHDIVGPDAPGGDACPFCSAVFKKPVEEEPAPEETTDEQPEGEEGAEPEAEEVVEEEVTEEPAEEGEPVEEVVEETTEEPVEEEVVEEEPAPEEEEVPVDEEPTETEEVVEEVVEEEPVEEPEPEPTPPPRRTVPAKPAVKPAARPAPVDLREQELERKRAQIRGELPYTGEQLKLMKRTTLLMVAGELGVQNPMRLGSADAIIAEISKAQVKKFPKAAPKPAAKPAVRPAATVPAKPAVRPTVPAKAPAKPAPKPTVPAKPAVRPAAKPAARK